MLKVVNMFKKFASQTALEDIQLEIRPGEFFSLLGPSGCGKTTLLRIIAGFETATSGELYWNDTRVDVIRPQDRPFNMIFQRYALFPHLSVFENVAFGLRVKKVREEHLAKRVRDALDSVGLADFANRLPETLSGGQAQRVAVARAIVNEPKILLLDEPLSALDQKMREHMQTELRSLQRRLGITFILVTHDQEEALALSDRIGVMSRGRLEQVSSPQALYANPQSHFVADFVGSMGSARGQSLGSSGAEAALQLKTGELVKGKGRLQDGLSAEAFVRPDRVRLMTDAEASSAKEKFPNQVPVQITNVAFRGLHYEVMLEIEPQQSLRALVTPDDMSELVKVGSRVVAAFRPDDTFVFERPQA